MPVQLIHDRWVSKDTRPQAELLAGLKYDLERSAVMTTPPTQVYQAFIRATPEQVWQAITQPEFTARYFYGSRVDTTGQTGTPIRHYAPDGTTLWGDDSISSPSGPGGWSTPGARCTTRSRPPSRPAASRGRSIRSPAGWSV